MGALNEVHDEMAEALDHDKDAISTREKQLRRIKNGSLVFLTAFVISMCGVTMELSIFVKALWNVGATEAAVHAAVSATQYGLLATLFWFVRALFGSIILILDELKTTV